MDLAGSQAGGSRRSLGLQIVETLVGQDLGGELRVERGEQGTRATIVVPSLNSVGETS